MELLGTLMIIYEVLSGIGGVLQITLILLRRTNNILLALGLLLDAIGLSGMCCGHLLSGQPMFALGDIAVMIIDIAYILYIIYKDEHPQANKAKK